jgi:NADH:ubiquinone reductase (H+-translocating)
MPRLLVIGGGFAGVFAALSAAAEIDEHGADIDITLVSNSPFITNRTRLYENHSAGLRAPLAPTLDPVGINFVLGDVNDIDTINQTVQVTLSDEKSDVLQYDRLVVAVGSQLKLPDIPGAAEFAWNIDTFEAAEKLDHFLRQRMQEPGPEQDRVFVIVGAGLTGLELATEMRSRLAEYSGTAAAERARVVLVERRRVVGPKLEEDAREIIERALSEAGVELRLKTVLKVIEQDAVVLNDGERIEAATVIITSGVHANPLAAALGGKTDGLGRLHTDETLLVTGVKNAYAAGDSARAAVDEAGHIALMSCQHAGTMGRYAGYNGAHDLMGLPLLTYRQERYVTCIDLGPTGAVFTSGWERTLQMQGAEAKALKKQIVLERIMPPTGSAEEILTVGKLKIT